MTAMLGWAEHTRAGELGQGEPERCRDLAVGNERHLLGKDEHERTHQDGRQHRATGSQVIELTEEIRRIEGYPDLFMSLPHGRDREVGVTRRGPASGKREVAGPHVSIALGAADQQKRIGIRRENERDSGAGSGTPLLGERSPACQSGPNSCESIYCRGSYPAGFWKVSPAP